MTFRDIKKERTSKEAQSNHEHSIAKKMSENNIYSPNQKNGDRLQGCLDKLINYQDSKKNFLIILPLKFRAASFFIKELTPTFGGHKYKKKTVLFWDIETFGIIEEPISENLWNKFFSKEYTIEEILGEVKCEKNNSF